MDEETSKEWEVLQEMLMGGRMEAGKDTVSTMGFISSRKHDGQGEPKLAIICDRSESVLVDDVNKIATKVPFETSVEGREIRGLAWRESLWPWEYAPLMARRELVSRLLKRPPK